MRGCKRLSPSSPSVLPVHLLRAYECANALLRAYSSFCWSAMRSKVVAIIAMSRLSISTETSRVKKNHRIVTCVHVCTTGSSPPCIIYYRIVTCTYTHQRAPFTPQGHTLD